MPWLILAEDSENGPALRRDRALMARMWAWELSIKDRILAAGSLRGEDGQTPVGSLMILDVVTKDEALALFAADPATIAGMRGKTTIRFWNRAILDGVAVD